MEGKRKGNANYKNNSKKAKYYGGCGGSKLEIGMRGVLISHDRNREKFCRIDSFRLLNYVADKLYGPEVSNDSDKTHASSDEDIESALSSEVSGIKECTKRDSVKKMRFSTVKSGCNNLIFVKCRGLTPSHLVHNVMEVLSSCTDEKTSDVPHTKNILRMHAVDLTCPAYMSEMCKIIPPFLEGEFAKLNSELTIQEKEYSIEYKCRNNSHLSRETVLQKLYEEMKDASSGWKYNCRSSKISVLIDVLKTVCMVSVVREYRTRKRFNVRELLLDKCKTVYPESIAVPTAVADPADDLNKMPDKVADRNEIDGSSDKEK